MPFSARWIPPALALFAACRSASLYELTATARDAGVRCIVVEPDLTLVSPFGPARTAELLERVRSDLGALERLFDVDVPASLVVLLEPVEAPVEVEAVGDRVRFQNVEAGGESGLLGLSAADGEAPVVVVYVQPDQRLVLGGGRSITMTFDLGEEDTIRHELAHVCAALAGLEGPTWFDEGLALVLEHGELDASGAFVPAAAPATLLAARELARSSSLDALLAWEEDAVLVHAGREAPFREGRPLAHALMRFLLERVGGPSLRDGLARVRDLSAQEIRALEPEWRAWLAALPPDGS